MAGIRISSSFRFKKSVRSQVTSFSSESIRVVPSSSCPIATHLPPHSQRSPRTFLASFQSERVSPSSAFLVVDSLTECSFPHEVCRAASNAIPDPYMYVFRAQLLPEANRGLLPFLNFQLSFCGPFYNNIFRGAPSLYYPQAPGPEVSERPPNCNFLYFILHQPSHLTSLLQPHFQPQFEPLFFFSSRNSSTFCHLNPQSVVENTSCGIWGSCVLYCACPRPEGPPSGGNLWSGRSGMNMHLASGANTSTTKASDATATSLGGEDVRVPDTAATPSAAKTSSLPTRLRLPSAATTRYVDGSSPCRQ